MVAVSADGGSIVWSPNGTTTSAATQSISPKFKLINTGSADISLSDVTIHYYYTIDDDKDQAFWCDWSNVGSDNVRGTFIEMNPALNGADYCLEIGFTNDAGTLAPEESIEIQTRMNRTDWSEYTQTGDYSFNSSASGYVDWSYTTGYISGTLEWGTEPQ